MEALLIWRKISVLPMCIYIIANYIAIALTHSRILQGIYRQLDL